jgi:hypothetical protein
MGKYVVLEGSKFTIYKTADQLRAYVEAKPSTWKFRSLSDFPKANGSFPSSKAIKAGTSVIISLSGGIVTPRWQSAVAAKWVI